MIEEGFPWFDDPRANYSIYFTFEEFQVLPMPLCCPCRRSMWMYRFEFRHKLIAATAVENNQINLVNQFISEYITNPGELTIDSEYIAVTILCKPRVKKIQIEYSKLPVIFHGVENSFYSFSDVKNIYIIPIQAEERDQLMDSNVRITILYIPTDEIEKFKVRLQLQFSNSWEITRITE